MDRAQKARFSRIKIAGSGKIAQSRDLKLQIPSSNIQENPNFKAPENYHRAASFWDLVIDISLELVRRSESVPWRRCWNLVIVLSKYSLVYRQPAPLDSYLGSNALANSAVETYKFVGQNPT